MRQLAVRRLGDIADVLEHGAANGAGKKRLVRQLAIVFKLQVQVIPECTARVIQVQVELRADLEATQRRRLGTKTDYIALGRVKEIGTRVLLLLHRRKHFLGGLWHVGIIGLGKLHQHGVIEVAAAKQSIEIALELSHVEEGIGGKGNICHRVNDADLARFNRREQQYGAHRPADGAAHLRNAGVGEHDVDAIVLDFDAHVLEVLTQQRLQHARFIFRITFPLRHAWSWSELGIGLWLVDLGHPLRLLQRQGNIGVNPCLFMAVIGLYTEPLVTVLDTTNRAFLSVDDARLIAPVIVGVVIGVVLGHQRPVFQPVRRITHPAKRAGDTVIAITEREVKVAEPLAGGNIAGAENIGTFSDVLHSQPQRRPPAALLGKKHLEVECLVLESTIIGVRAIGESGHAADPGIAKPDLEPWHKTQGGPEGAIGVDVAVAETPRAVRSNTCVGHEDEAGLPGHTRLRPRTSASEQQGSQQARL